MDLRTKALSRTGRQRALILSLVSGVLIFGAGCTEDDTGRCCTVLPGMDGGVTVPEPEVDMNGEPRDIVKVNVAFDCENLTCVSYQGSAAYCTKECAFDASCPKGFVCSTVLQSDPGPDSMIRPETKFCVRPEMQMCIKP